MIKSDTIESTCFVKNLTININLERQENSKLKSKLIKSDTDLNILKFLIFLFSILEKDKLNCYKLILKFMLHGD